MGKFHHTPMPHLEVITGPMFSGKSEILISRLNRSRIGGLQVLTLKPACDERTAGVVASRAISDDGSSVITAKLDAVPVRDERHLRELLAGDDFDVLGIDEAHFFEEYLAMVIRDLMRARRGSKLLIYIAGCDLTFAGEPFQVMAHLLAYASERTTVHAVCVCGADAQFSQRLSESREELVVGDYGSYAPRCGNCFIVPT